MKALLILFGILLIGAVISLFMGMHRAAMNEIIPNLNKVFPLLLEDWRVEDMPLAQSLEISREVKSILQYDSVVFRKYSNPEMEILLFAAYWRAGKVPVELIDAHTPDICWVAAGWQLDKNVQEFEKWNTESVVWSLNKRTFTKNNDSINVIYWHINQMSIRNQLSINWYSLDLAEKTNHRFMQIWNQVYGGANDHIYFRISSRIKHEKMMKSAPVLSALQVTQDALGSEYIGSALREAVSYKSAQIDKK